MSVNHNKKSWQAYVKNELHKAEPVLLDLDIKLDKEQVHLSGERFLMSGEKLVLTGRMAANNQKVIVKLSSSFAGQQEIKREYDCNLFLQNLNFAHFAFHLPKIFFFRQIKGIYILILEFIDEPKPFLSFPLEDQFFMALRTFEIQAGAHATTAGHISATKKIFGILSSDDYLRIFQGFIDESLNNDSKNISLKKILLKADNFLKENRVTIETYNNFFTHADFTLHNLRVVGRDIFLLDQASIRFGNKYESWARLLNYMLLYNKKLEELLVSYVKENRSSGEFLSLRLMRIFKLGYLLAYYTRSLSNTDGDLYKLTRSRIDFWSRVMDYMLDNKTIPNQFIEDYKVCRDSLRSQDEIKRQQQMGQLS